MKIFNSKKLGAFTLTQLLCVLALLALLAALVIPARAQLTVTPGAGNVPYAKTYWLTNRTTFTMSSGGTNVATSASVLIASDPFPLMPGKGFALTAEHVGTNASTAAVTYNFQFATPIKVGGSYVTNWNTYGLAAVGTIMNGTTRVYAFTNVPPALANHAQLCRLFTVANAHTASVFLSPTNTYVTITP